MTFQLWYSRYHDPLFLVLLTKNGFLIQNSAEFTVEMNGKSRNTVCNLGILANAFEMAASETTYAFSPCWSDTEIRDRICGKVLVTLKSSFERDIEIQKKNKMTVITIVRIIMIKQNRKVPFISSKKFLWRLTLGKLKVPSQDKNFN